MSSPVLSLIMSDFNLIVHFRMKVTNLSRALFKFSKWTKTQDGRREKLKINNIGQTINIFNKI